MTTEVKDVRTIDDILGVPVEPAPVAPPWHVDSEDCLHGWIIGGSSPTWGTCDCEDPANPWPARVPGDGPRDCQCYRCAGHKPRHERGRLAGCEYKDHHCDDCHEHGRCTVSACGFDEGT